MTLKILNLESECKTIWLLINILDSEILFGKQLLFRIVKFLMDVVLMSLFKGN